MKRTVKQAYRKLGMPNAGSVVNDLMASLGVTEVRLGAKKLKVTGKRKPTKGGMK